MTLKVIQKPVFGARVELGDPLFITISPNSRLSGMCVRLTRYRNTDPLVVHGGATEDSVSPWSLNSAWEPMHSVQYADVHRGVHCISNGLSKAIESKIGLKYIFV